MADEANIPSHRWYQDRYHIRLPMQDVSQAVIKAAGVRKIDQVIVSPLFAAGEQGVWYDPSDLTTLFQDSAGTTPVTAAGQPVGLMLDKRIPIGSELASTLPTPSISNSGGTVGAWIAGTSTISNTVVGTVSNFPRFQFDFGFVTGRMYGVSITFDDATQITDIRVGGSAGPSLTKSGNTFFGYKFSGAATTLWVQGNGLAVWSAQITSASVREVSGNHATQATSAQRPVYGIHPITGIRNLLTYTEQFDNAYWLKAASGTGTLPTVTSNFDLAPDESLTADRVQLDSGLVGNSQVSSSNFTAPNVVGANYTFSIWMRSLSGSPLVTMFSNAQTQNVTVTPTWQRFTFTQTASLAADTVRLSKRDIWGSAGSADILVWGAQYESGSTATVYQSVSSQFEVSETGVSPVYYLSFDGVDDNMVTASMVPSTDKVQLFMGVRKLTDSLFPIAAELSVNSGANNGSFTLQGRNTGASGWSMGTRGTLNASTIASGTAAPVTNVISGLGDISAPSVSIRLNGTLISTSTATQGTGNFLTYPMYIGRRQQGATQPLNGRIYSIITRFGANLTADQITSIETWINAKVGAY